MAPDRGRPSFGKEWINRNIAFAKQEFEEVEIIRTLAPTGQTSFNAAVRKAVELYIKFQMERDVEIRAAVEAHRRNVRKVVPLPRKQKSEDR
jgi:hypothetical protein